MRATNALLSQDLVTIQAPLEMPSLQQLVVCILKLEIDVYLLALVRELL
jgi:hypothetical protein